MKITFISDTHSYHDKLKLSGGDMIVHAGDISKMGTKQEVVDFLNWFKDLNYKYKIFIAGNHDFYFEKESALNIKNLVPENIHYLNDSGITINGINFWGSPIQPLFFNMAFNKKRGEEIRSHWDLIPDDTNILITHGPPQGILDKIFTGENVGCKDLLEVVTLKKPKIHLFGHIHECYGIEESNGIQYINASVLDEKYNFVNDPIEIVYA